MPWSDSGTSSRRHLRKRSWDDARRGIAPRGRANGSHGLKESTSRPRSSAVWIGPLIDLGDWRSPGSVSRSWLQSSSWPYRPHGRRSPTYWVSLGSASSSVLTSRQLRVTNWRWVKRCPRRRPSPNQVWMIATPADLAPPEAIYLSNSPVEGEVTMVWAPSPTIPEIGDTGVGLLITQFRATGDRQLSEASDIGDPGGCGPGIRRGWLLDGRGATHAGLRGAGRRGAP